MTGEQAVAEDGTKNRTPRPRFNHGCLNMRIARDGQWYYHGSLIARKEMVCLFSSMLTRREDGTYWLVTPAEEGTIEVEDAPFQAVELFRCGTCVSTVFSFRTNVDEIITLDKDHPLRMGEGSDAPLYITVRPGLEARLTRAVYYEIINLGVEGTVDGKPCCGIWSSGEFFPLGWY